MVLRQVNPPAGGLYRLKQKRHAHASLVDPARSGALCVYAAPGAPVTLDKMEVSCGHCKVMLAQARRMRNK